MRGGEDHIKRKLRWTDSYRKRWEVKMVMIKKLNNNEPMEMDKQ